MMAAAAVLGGKAVNRGTNKNVTVMKAVDLSKELGACPPAGFWDPLQLAEFDDPELAAQIFKRRRSVEIQHGRVSMIATIGYIVPEYFRWPGYVSPSQKLAFADVPNGLAAWNAVPAVGWWQMIGFVGCIEVANLSSAGDKEYAGDYDGYGAFGVPRGGTIVDKEKKEKSTLAITMATARSACHGAAQSWTRRRKRRVRWRLRWLRRVRRATGRHNRG